MIVAIAVPELTLAPEAVRAKMPRPAVRCAQGLRAQGSTAVQPAPAAASPSRAVDRGDSVSSMGNLRRGPRLCRSSRPDGLRAQG